MGWVLNALERMGVDVEFPLQDETVEVARRFNFLDAADMGFKQEKTPMQLVAESLARLNVVDDPNVSCVDIVEHGNRIVFSYDYYDLMGKHVRFKVVAGMKQISDHETILTIKRVVR